MVLDEPNKTDDLYAVYGINFLISKGEKEIPYVQIDYIKDWQGGSFVITSGF